MTADATGDTSTGLTRALTCAGGVLAAASVALAAYAAHGAPATGAATLQLAAVFALCHGIALVALAPRARRRLGKLALAALLAGSVLFAGSLAAAQLLGTSTRWAPAGGMLLIAGWLLHAIDAWRR